MIGVHWFQYADEPTGGRADGEDYDFGLVDIDDRPYGKLIRALRASNRLARWGMARPIAPEPARGSRPRPAAGLARADDADPGRLAEGGVAGADDRVRLARCRSAICISPGTNDGLFLATIAMDYYAPELLGRSQSFRARRRSASRSGSMPAPGRAASSCASCRSGPCKCPRRETKLSFDAQICRYEQGDACAAVPGATARYFGTALDQPRVILKAFIPWHQLGLSGPPRRADLRIEIGVTAFYRSRWMSRSGLAPEVAMNDPASWLPVRLGGAARDWPAEAGDPESRAAEPAPIELASMRPGRAAASAAPARNRGGSKLPMRATGR